VSTSLPGREGPIRILVVDDEISYREALSSGLAREGFEVETASDGREAIRRYGASRHDLVLLDVMLPDLSGIEVFAHLRDLGTCPVLMVSARGEEAEVVAALNMGVTDYVVKPFLLSEMVARVRAILRRHPASAARYGVAAEGDSGAGGTGTQASERPGVVVAGDLRIDLHSREVSRAGEPVRLSRLEFDLLALLVSPPGKARTRDELLDALWGERDIQDSRTLDTHMTRLRSKLERDPAHPAHLITLRGVGFRFDVPLTKSSL
jgi:two-component system response regulator RegX3